MLDVGCVGLVLVTWGNVCRQYYAHPNFRGVASEEESLSQIINPILLSLAGLHPVALC